MLTVVGLTSQPSLVPETVGEPAFDGFVSAMSSGAMEALLVAQWVRYAISPLTLPVAWLARLKSTCETPTPWLRYGISVDCSCRSYEPIGSAWAAGATIAATASARVIRRMVNRFVRFMAVTPSRRELGMSRR